MTVMVIKRAPSGQALWQYTAKIIARGETFVTLEARFDRPDRPFMETTLRLGDRFVETFFYDRWYNIFEIHAVEDDRLKGWYCNLGHPAVWDAPDALSYVDLALDVWVSAAGKLTVLDEDEYAALALDEKTRHRVDAALDELSRLKWREGLQPEGL